VSGDESIINGEPQSLVVQLRYGKDNVPKVPVDKPPPLAQEMQMKSTADTGLPGSSSTHLAPIQPPAAPASAQQYPSEATLQAPMPRMPPHSIPPSHWAPQPALGMHGSSMPPLLSAPETRPQLLPVAAQLPYAPQPQSFSQPPVMNASAMPRDTPAPHPSSYGATQQRPTMVAPSMPAASVPGTAPLEAPKPTQPAESNGISEAKQTEPGPSYPPGLPPMQSHFFQGRDPPH
jgi:hypothetical protein